jgi:hypothetical protein
MDEEVAVMEKSAKKITVVPEKLVFQQAPDEAVEQEIPEEVPEPETAAPEEKVVANTITEEAEENQTVEEEAEPEPAAAKRNVVETEVKTAEKDNNINVVGFLVQLVIVVITVHGYLEYSMFSGETGNWLWALGSLFLPVINLGWAFCGLIYYWEIHWALALIITATCFLALLPKVPGYTCAVICISLFAICASYTFPKSYTQEKMVQEFKAELAKSESVFDSSINSKAAAVEFCEARISKFKQIRVRALRLGYPDLAEAARVNIKIGKELLQNLKRQ